MVHDILIVDDEADIRLLIAGILDDEGFGIREAANSDDALKEVASRLPSLVILDIWLLRSALDGMQILERLKAVHPDLPVVMISGHGNIETAVSAIKLGAYDFIEKPFKADRLLLLVRRAIEAARLRQENQELKRKVGTAEQLVGVSAGLAQVRAWVAKVAPTNSRVLITGPAGPGTEGGAATVHLPSEYLGGVLKLCQDRRGAQRDLGAPVEVDDAPAPTVDEAGLTPPRPDGEEESA